MLSNIRKRVKLTPSGVIAVMALVFATTGGAFAMNGGGGGSSPSKVSASLTRAGTTSATAAKSKAKAKAPARGPAGPQGKTGPAGPAGPAGAAGEKGASGGQGPQGSQGPQGPEGKEGKAGTNGTNGKEGSPWTAGGTLPPEKTETGTWSWESTVATLPLKLAISFPIPLSAALAETQVHYIDAAGQEITFPEPTNGLVFTGPTLVEKKSTECLGSAEKPTAEPGNLCLYGASESGKDLYSYAFHDPEQITVVNTVGTEEAGTTGTILWFHAAEKEEAQGTWAVTAPEAK